ncbi:MAG TPA: ATP-binding cassette domain-containing protein [Mycobacteriales bacterium]|nr:ATP-binding cassette domain-containing protein [Mycobacteriales bacterium]
MSPWRVVARAALAVLAVIALAEALFGRSGTGRWLGVPFWDGVPFGLLVNGAVIGLLYGLVGVGIVLVHRATGVINFAQAAMGSLPALAALLLVAGRGWPYWAGVLVMLVGSVLVGLLVEVLFLRRFAHKPRLVVTVATIGVSYLLTFLESKEPDLLTGSALAPVSFPTPFSGFRFDAGGLLVNGDYVAVLVVSVAVLVGLATLLRVSRLGMAVRACAENADRAALLGIPVARVTTVVWVLATVLAGVAAFLRGPVVGLPVGTGVSPSVLLYGLAAAVVARMQSLPVALAAGCALGVMEQASVYGTTKPDLAVALVLPVVLLALLLRPSRASRAFDTGVSSFRALPEARPVPRELVHLTEVRVVRWGAWLLIAGLALGGPFLVGRAHADTASFLVICATVAVSMVVLSGWAGQVSLGQFALVGIGAAVAGALATRLDADFFVTLVAAGAAGAVAALLIGIPALRMQGLYLAVVTLAFAATVRTFALSRDYFGDLLPAADARISRPVLWDRVDTSSGTAYYYVCLAGLVLAVLVARGLRRSRSGRLFLGVRDNVRAAQSYGVSPTATRLAAFAVSGFIAALAGALFAYQQGSLDPQSFSLELSIEAFVFTVVGGLAGVGPAVAGAVVFEGLKYLRPVQHLLGDTDVATFIDTFFVHSSPLFVLTFAPGGLGELFQRARDRWLRAVARRHDVVVPWLTEDRSTEQLSRAVPSAPPPADAVLVCRGVDAGYDGVQVLFGVDLEVRRGEVLALLGTNGAGKSTLLRVVSGLLPATAGQVLLDGEDVTGLDPVALARRGVVQVPGGRGIFPTLTVREHLVLAGWLLEEGPDLEARREELLDGFPRLRERHDQLAGNLSGGEQQQLALAMALLSRPRLLVVDELSLGLAPAVVDQLLEVLRGINADGTAVLLVEQSVNVALTVADRAYFLEKGEVRFEGPTAELLERDDVARSVFLAAGTTAAARERSEDPTGRPVVLEARGLGVVFGGVRAVHDVSLSVRAGEVLGILGPNGAGKTTVFDVISGLLPPQSGRVVLLGEDVTAERPWARARRGLGRSFQDARLFPSLTVAECIALALERHLPVRDHLGAALWLPGVREAEDDVAWTVADLVELLHLGAFRDKLVGELSTGSRRVVDLAMALAHDPAVLLLDEPSSGIAQREAEALVPLLERMRAETGAALLVIEHDLPLLTAVSDRLLALDLGVVLLEGPPDEVVSDPRVVSSYLGTPDGAAVARSGPRRAAADREQVPV